jgi:hypothetical protein
MKQRTFVYVACSSRRRAGTTLLARLLFDFLSIDDPTLTAFDTNVYEPTLSERLGGAAVGVDLATTIGQVTLFDRLILADQAPKVVDLWQRHFALFFSLIHEIGFVEELRRQAVELIILFLADADLASFEAIRNLRNGFPALTFVPVINEATARTAAVAGDARERLLAQFRYNIRIPALDPVLSLLIDGPGFSFSQFMRDYPGERSLSGQTTLYAWIRGIFNQFRDLHLRMTLHDLGRTLKKRPTGRAR